MDRLHGQPGAPPARAQINVSGGGCSPSDPGAERGGVGPARARTEGAAGRAGARRGPKKRRFTKTQEQLLRAIAAETVVSGGLACTKRELAERLGRNVKTIDRLIADLRRRGYVEEEMRFDERGGQLASVYRAVAVPPAPR